MQLTLTIANERATEFEYYLNEQFEVLELNDLRLQVLERDFYTDFHFTVEAEEEAEALESMEEYFK